MTAPHQGNDNLKDGQRAVIGSGVWLGSLDLELPASVDLQEWIAMLSVIGVKVLRTEVGQSGFVLHTSRTVRVRGALHDSQSQGAS
jgi:hypothetical protein